MANVDLKTLFNSKTLPILNPVADQAALTALPTADLLAGALCETLDDGVHHVWNGTTWEIKDAADWVALPAYSSKWTSNAFVTKFDNGTKAIFRGTFTSTADNNEDPIGTYPAGYSGGGSLGSQSVTASIARNFINYKKGRVTWSGGDSVLTVPVPGMKNTDDVEIQIRTGGGVSAYGSWAAPNDDQFVVTIPVADPSNTLRFCYFIFRTQPITQVDLGTDGSVFGITPPVDNGDVVYMDGVSYNLV